MEEKKFGLTTEDFEFLDDKMKSMDFRKTSILGQKKLFRRLGLVPPREIKGRETTYLYHNNGYTVVVHTTYLEREKKWRGAGEDAGWVLIKNRDRAVYFARPFQRKKGFLLKLLRYAWITKWKIDHRPLCPTCSAYMNVKRKSGSRQYFWMCDRKEKHESDGFVFLPWDYMLPKKATEFVTIRRAYTEKYNELSKKAGIQRRPAGTIRKKWIIKKPENLE